jgi:hypothetical protein
MTTDSVPTDAAMRTGRCLIRYETTSANVYLPRFRSGSAIRKSTIGQPTRNPIE